MWSFRTDPEDTISLASFGICGIRRKKEEQVVLLVLSLVPWYVEMVLGDVSVGVVGAGTVYRSGFPVGSGGAGGLYPVGVVLLVGSASVTSRTGCSWWLCPSYP